MFDWSSSSSFCAPFQPIFKKKPDLASQNSDRNENRDHLMRSEFAMTFSWIRNASMRTEMAFKESKSPTFFMCSRKRIVVEDGNSWDSCLSTSLCPTTGVVYLSVYKVQYTDVPPPWYFFKASRVIQWGNVLKFGTWVCFLMMN